jgi:hypothetical protein
VKPIVGRLIILTTIAGCSLTPPSGIGRILMSGPVQIDAATDVHAGYAGTIAGGKWSMALAWPEPDAASQSPPMSMGNLTPLLAFYSDSQPITGVHQIGPALSSRLYTLMIGPHTGMQWRSDSGTLTFTRSDRNSGAVAGSFDVWLRCPTRRCPCPQPPCIAEARGQFDFPHAPPKSGSH